MRSRIIRFVSVVALLFPALTSAAIPMVAPGTVHTAALKSDGTVLAWGWNSNGLLGDGTMIPRSSPVAVYGLTGVVASISRNPRVLN